MYVFFLFVVTLVLLWGTDDQVQEYMLEADIRAGDRGSAMCYTYSCSKGMSKSSLGSNVKKFVAQDSSHV